MSTLDRSSTPISAGLALTSAAFVVLLVWTASPLGATIGGLGWLVCLLGLVRRARGWITVGVGALWLAVVVGATAGLPNLAVLFAVVLVIVAWDAGRRAIHLGVDLTRNASTRRVELLHGAATMLVGAGSLLVVYSLSVAVPPEDSVLAVAALFLAAFVLLWALYSA